MLLCLLAGFLLALTAPLLHRLLGRHSGAWFALLPLTQFVYLFSVADWLSPDFHIFAEAEWLPSLGINLSFHLDGLSLLFSLLITLFGAFVLYYSSGYLGEDAKAGRFYLYLLLFANAMLGLVLADNVLTLFVFWELTSISSYMLIGFKHEDEKARASAQQALLVTGLGGLSMLAGFLILSNITGTYSLQEMLASSQVLKDHSFYLPILILLFLGVFTKSAQFPFHFWLPNAMAAPTPVSAYLHSATMVKAGIYLLARLSPLLGGTPYWQQILLTAGGVTMLVGAIMAIKQKDLKGILAYTTISALGKLTFLLSMGTAYAIRAAMLYLLAHALYKGTLFMVAGSIDHSTGTRDITALSGLRRKAPYLATAAALACLSMAGVIPFLGFIAKEAFYEATLQYPAYSILLIGVVFVANALSATVALMLGYELFYGKESEIVRNAHRPALPLSLPPLLLGCTGLFFGLLPAWLAQPLLSRSVAVILAKTGDLHLKLWHGFNLVLVLSLLTLLVGWLMYLGRKRWRKPVPAFLAKLGPDYIYQLALTGLKKTAYYQTRFWQNGYLRIYVSVVLLAFVSVQWYALYQHDLTFDLLGHLPLLLDVRAYELATILLTVPALLFLFRSRSRLTAIATMGVIGFSIGAMFIFFGAPDVGITQFLIETLTVVLFVLVLHKLPEFHVSSSRLQRIKYLVVSVLFGSTMTFILLLLVNYNRPGILKSYYGETSWALAKGRNIVNVILVDFRALDTLGEITVLATAAIGILSLLRLIPKNGGKL